MNVGFEPAVADCEWAPRLAEDGGERGVMSQKTH